MYYGWVTHQRAILQPRNVRLYRIAQKLYCWHVASTPAGRPRGSTQSDPSDRSTVGLGSGSFGADGQLAWALGPVSSGPNLGDHRAGLFVADSSAVGQVDHRMSGDDDGDDVVGAQTAPKGDVIVGARTAPMIDAVDQRTGRMRVGQRTGQRGARSAQKTG